MQEMAKMTNAKPFSTKEFSYKNGKALRVNSSVYDANMYRACVCESFWPVGLGPGETQEPTFFGPACELHHCPSGDNPATKVDETDCSGISVYHDGEVGQPGNLCHVDCSNQGLCDYQTGYCSCFDGYTGHNCAMRVSELLQINANGDIKKEERMSAAKGDPIQVVITEEGEAS